MFSLILLTDTANKMPMKIKVKLQTVLASAFTNFSDDRSSHYLLDQAVCKIDIQDEAVVHVTSMVPKQQQ